MACNVVSSKRKPYVQRIVRESIKAADKGNPSVTQDTMLGHQGLGHGTLVRKRYHKEITVRLQPEGCRMKALTPESFADSKLIRVRDVTDLVLKDLV